MAGQSKRTKAPAPMEFPRPTAAQIVPPPTAHMVPPPPMFVPGAWLPPRPPQSMADSSPPCWIAGVQPPSTAGSKTQVPMWTEPMAENLEDNDLQAWGFDSHPHGGFLNLINNTSSHAKARNNWSSLQPINGSNEKGGRAWLQNSNDPIQSNYRKNDQYWKDVAAVYNSTTPKNRERQVKQVKDRFAKIKKKVAWFCGSYREAEALYASGENDADLKKRAIQTYEEDHKDDGPFMFEHCWEVLKKQPKWDAYLERLEDLESGKRKFVVDDEVGKHFTLDDVQDERPPGGKQAKGKPKRKRNDESCIIDLEDELNKFVEVQHAANEGRKEMLETQKRVSTENLEARKLAYLAAKDHKESVMLETYRSLMMQDTTLMSEDVRSEHILAMKCFREKLFGKTN
ncbi:hypothetical protein ZWY2020_024362 [Hordeum vulgare]|nr:hypothetical protein ZWY2020_024362 [Hordeum vulgare]